MNEFLANIDRPTLIKVTAIYFVLSAIFGVCGGVAAITGGAIAGVAGVGAGISAEVAATAAALDPNSAAAINEAQTAAAAAGGFGALLAILGVVYLITAPVLAIAAFGLFNRKPWARQLTVIIAGVMTVINLLSIFGGFSFTNLVQLVLSAFVAYMFSQDAATRAQFGT